MLSFDFILSPPFLTTYFVEYMIVMVKLSNSDKRSGRGCEWPYLSGPGREFGDLSRQFLIHVQQCWVWTDCWESIEFNVCHVHFRIFFFLIITLREKWFCRWMEWGKTCECDSSFHIWNLQLKKFEWAIFLLLMQYLSLSAIIRMSFFPNTVKSEWLFLQNLLF